MWDDWKLILCIVGMAIHSLQSFSIKRPKRIPFPYRSMRDKSLSRLSCRSYSSAPPPNHARYCNQVTESVGCKSKPDIHRTAITKTPRSKDTMTSYHCWICSWLNLCHTIQSGSSNISPTDIYDLIPGSRIPDTSITTLSGITIILVTSIEACLTRDPLIMIRTDLRFYNFLGHRSDHNQHITPTRK